MSDSTKKAFKKIEAFDTIIVICQGSKCKKNGSQDIRKSTKRYLKDRKLTKRVHICRSQCQGFCKVGPIVTVFPNNHWIVEADEEKVFDILSRYYDDK